jgi:hypothetical protein
MNRSPSPRPERAPEESSGTVTIWPIETSTTGIPPLHLSQGDGRVCALELRRQSRPDQGIPSSLVNGILVRIANGSTAQVTALIDMSNIAVDRNDAKLLSGQTFSATRSPDSIKLVSVGTCAAQVQT